MFMELPTKPSHSIHVQAMMIRHVVCARKCSLFLCADIELRSFQLLLIFPALDIVPPPPNAKDIVSSHPSSTRRPPQGRYARFQTRIE